MPAFDLDTCFPSTYASARDAFLGAAVRAGAAIASYRHELRGPSGEELATDIALLGRPDARNVLVLVCGTHGVEGLPGSGLLVAQLRSGVLAVPRPDLAIMLVHALNPFGVAAKRRVNEDNVDINRNFAAFPADLPNPEYDALHGLLTMAPIGMGRLRRKVAIAAHVARVGKRGLQQAVTKGQFAHSTGLFFGGHAPTWSRRTWDRIVADVAGKERVLVLDYHTGLGQRGSGQLISPMGSASGPEDGSWRTMAMAACFGQSEVRYLEKGDAVSTPISGDLLSYTMHRGDHVATVALEFGTYPPLRVLRALMNENWAHHAGDDRIGRYRDDLVEVFSPDDRTWRQAVYARAAAVTNQAIRGLTQAEPSTRR